MDGSRSCEPSQRKEKRQDEEQNINLDEEELEEDDEDEEEEEEDDDDDEAEMSKLGELQPVVELPSSQQEGERSRDAKLELSVAAPSSSAVLPGNDQSSGCQGVSRVETHVEGEFKVQVGLLHQEVLASVTSQSAEIQAQNQLAFSVCPTSMSVLSPTSVTQPISPAPSGTLPEQLSPLKVKNACKPEADQQNSSDLQTLTVVPIVKAPIPDGYNWRKYGQKQVKSPTGFRSYYRCTHSDCCAKKIECSDHSGLVIEIVNKGTHSHDPLQKNNCTRESKAALSAAPVFGNGLTEHPIRMLKDPSPATVSKELLQETPLISEGKRQKSAGSDRNGEIQLKGESVGEPEPKRRMKKEDLACPRTLLKPGKKPKLVVHAVSDVAISGDGYRWRKYGQKMVKGNPNPRNYYRCTSAGCPVRKHIETAVDNTSAVIITYKGVHDHDMPVPKRRHGPPSAPLVAAAAPASMNNLQLKKTDTLQSQATSTHWSVGKEGELTSETSDIGSDKEKAIESARTLLSIGFEIKPC